MPRGRDRTGIEQVSTPRELIDAAQALLAPYRPEGRRLAVFGDGGGHGVIAADLADAAGFDLPELSAELSGRLADALGPTAGTRNPVDFAGGGEQDIRRFELVARLLLGSGEVDAALLTGYFGGYAEYGPEHAEVEADVARGIAAAASESQRPLVVQTMYPGLPAAAAFRRAGVPVYREVEAAVSALTHLAARTEQAPRGIPAMPAPAAGPPTASGYHEVREVLARAGIPFVPARLAQSVEETRTAAADLGYPVVLKALGVLHKSDAGGVVLRIESEEELERVFAELDTRLSPEAYSVERMAPLGDGVELIAGVRRDIRFGPIVLVGIGGIYAELLRDVAVTLAPVGEAEAEELLRSLRASPLLLGARGREAVDLRSAARAVATLSRVAAERSEIAEVEINPLLVTPNGALGLDARVVLVDCNPDAR